jgi:hypothetical protein
LALCSKARDDLAEFWIRHKDNAKAAKVYKEWLDWMAKYHCGHPDEIQRIEHLRADILTKS